MTGGPENGGERGPGRGPSLAPGIAVLVLAVFTAAGTAAADSWMPPTPREYLSPDGVYRFTVIPRGIASALDYFTGLTKGVDRPGQAAAGPDFCRGILERRKADGSASVIWDRPLLNDVAPVEALVAPSGNHVVTFDNWHAVGYGNDVVVIYDAAGKIIRRAGLEDLLLPAEIAALPRTVSSIWWGSGHRISADGATLILRIVVNGKMHYEEAAEFRELRLSLASGEAE